MKLKTSGQICPPGNWVIAKFSNFTQIKVLEKKQLVATLFGVFEESPHDRISDLLTHLIKKCFADIATIRVIVL